VIEANTNIRVRKAVRLYDQTYWLCGRLVHKVERDLGYKEIQSWQLCGGVYSKRDPPLHIRDMVFVPWIIPIPVIQHDGSVDIQIVAQVAKDVANVITATEAPKANPKYKGEIRYTLSTKRRIGYIRNSIHLGEIYSTSIDGEFLITLHSIPFLLVEPDGVGHIHPIMVLMAQAPLWNRRRLARAKKKNQASDRRILRGG